MMMMTAAITEFNTDVNADSNGNPDTEVDVDANTNANANANANDYILPEPLINHMTLPPILSSSFEETNEDENNDNDVNAPQTNNQGVQQIKLMTPKKYVFENTDNDPNPLNKLPSIPLVQPMINASSNPVSFQSMASSLNSHRKSLSTATTLPIIMQHAHKGSMPLYFVPTKLSELQQKEKEFKKNEKRIKKQQKKLQKEMLQELKQTQQYKKYEHEENIAPSISRHLTSKKHLIRVNEEKEDTLTKQKSSPTFKSVPNENDVMDQNKNEKIPKVMVTTVEIPPSQVQQSFPLLEGNNNHVIEMQPIMNENKNGGDTDNGNDADADADYNKNNSDNNYSTDPNNTDKPTKKSKKHKKSKKKTQASWQ